MIRGIERRRIFNDDKDRENFIDRLSILLPETGTTCYAWAFMPNHAHFIFRSGHSGIPTLMRRLLTGDIYYRLGKDIRNDFGRCKLCGQKRRDDRRREQMEIIRLSY
jgi:REP element-mobilizing transposase RayT